MNLSNDALLALAVLPSVRGVKDCCADFGQTGDLLARRGPDFSVLTGEDALFYTALAQGADGGILASAYYETAAFADVYVRMIGMAPAIVYAATAIHGADPVADKILVMASREDRESGSSLTDDRSKCRIGVAN